MNTHHEAMDDTAEFGTELNTREGLHSVNTRRPLIPQGCDQQGRLTPTIEPKGDIAPQPAEAATEVGVDDDSKHVSGALAWPLYCLIAVLAVWACWHLAGRLVA